MRRRKVINVYSWDRRDGEVFLDKDETPDQRDGDADTYTWDGGDGWKVARQGWLWDGTCWYSRWWNAAGEGWDVGSTRWQMRMYRTRVTPKVDLWDGEIVHTQDGEKLREQDERPKVDLRDLICLHIFTLLQHLVWTKNLFLNCLIFTWLLLLTCDHLEHPPTSLHILSRSLTHMVFEISINSAFLNQFQDGHLKTCDLVSKFMLNSPPHPISMQDHLWPQFPMDGCWGHLWMGSWGNERRPLLVVLVWGRSLDERNKDLIVSNKSPPYMQMKLLPPGPKLSLTLPCRAFCILQFISEGWEISWTVAHWCLLSQQCWPSQTESI